MHVGDRFVSDSDDTIPVAADTIPAPPPSSVEAVSIPVLRPVTFFPSVLQALPPDESGSYPSLGKRFDADAFASDLLDDD